MALREHDLVLRQVRHLLLLAKRALPLSALHQRQLLAAALRNYADNYLRPPPDAAAAAAAALFDPRPLLPSPASAHLDRWLRSLPPPHPLLHPLLLSISAAAPDQLLALANNYHHSDLHRRIAAQLAPHVPLHFDPPTLHACLLFLPHASRLPLHPDNPPLTWPVIALAYSLLYLCCSPQPPDAWYASLLHSLSVAYAHPHHSQLMLLLPFITVTAAPPIPRLAHLFTALRCGHVFSVFTVLHLTHHLSPTTLSDPEKHTLLASALPFPTFPFQNLLEHLA